MSDAVKSHGGEEPAKDQNRDNRSEPPFEPSAFFQNRACPHFPCHEGIPDDRFNCLLCYCPLYALGEACGGNFSYTAKGTKNCIGCTIPHDGVRGIALVKERFPELAKLARRNRAETDGAR